MEMLLKLGSLVKIAFCRRPGYLFIFNIDYYYQYSSEGIISAMQL